MVKRILVVDDDTEAHPALQEALEVTGGFEVFMCSDPRAALGQAKLLRPDLIVLDVVMPMVSGVEVAKRLQTHPDTAAIPILYLTAFAGYVEQGETVEEAVQREVMEEAGVAVGEVVYYASQPWPFPSSLMIGCFAHALSEDFEVDSVEITEARWFTREELREALDSPDQAGFSFPDRLAIAHHLIRAWCDRPF